MMSEAVHLDGSNLAYSIRLGRNKSWAPPEWNRLKVAVEYFQEYDVEIHIHGPTWARGKFHGLIENEFDDSVVLHWVDITEFDRELDDKDLLAWALLTDGYIVSNDTMQNHIERGSIKEDWFEIRRIPYHFKKTGAFCPKLPTEFPVLREEKA